MQAVTGAGRVIAGRYQLLDLLGQGAMGTVWRAHDPVLAREVAIKEIRLPALMGEAERQVLRQRTLREARVAGKLSHPGVVTVYDVVEADGNPWIVMELVPARSLERVVREDGPLPAQRVAEIGVMLLEALASAHAAGIVHRDVKPANVLIAADGRAVLSDFGIATLEGEVGLTQAGMVMGTPGFCAPERIRGEPAAAASDLWSLGATLYAAAEGHGPFQSQESAMAILASIVHSDPPTARSAGPVGLVISALMSKDPAQRPDAATAARQLERASAGQPPLPPTAALPVPGPGAPDAPPRAVPAPHHAPDGHRAAAGPPRARTHPAPAGPGGRSAPPARRHDAGAGDVPWPWPPQGPVPSMGENASDGARPTAGPAAGSVGGHSRRPNPAQPSGRAAMPPPGPPRPGTPGHGPAGHAAGPAGGPADAAGRPTGAATRPGGVSATAPATLPPAPGRPGVPAARPGEAAGNRAPLPGSTRVAGRAAATGRPVRRWLPIALTAVGIVCAGLIIGALAARRHPAPTGSGAATRSTGTRSAGTAGLPAGYRWYSSPAGGPAAFSVAVPQGWQVVQRGVVHLVRDPATGASVKLAALPAGTSLIGQISLLAQRASHDPGYQRIAIVPGFSSLRLRFSFRRHGVGLMAGMDVVARFGPLGARQTEEFLLSTPAGNSGPAGLALAEMLRTFQPQA